LHTSSPLFPIHASFFNAAAAANPEYQIRKKPSWVFLYWIGCVKAKDKDTGS